MEPNYTPNSKPTSHSTKPSKTHYTSTQISLRNYQPMPPAEPHGLLHHPLQPNKHRFRPVIPRHHHFRVPREHRKLLLAAISAALQLRKSAINRALHSFKHFPIPLIEFQTKNSQKTYRLEFEIFASECKTLH